MPERLSSCTRPLTQPFRRDRIDSPPVHCVECRRGFFAANFLPAGGVSAPRPPLRFLPRPPSLADSLFVSIDLKSRADALTSP